MFRTSSTKNLFSFMVQRKGDLNGSLDSLEFTPSLCLRGEKAEIHVNVTVPSDLCSSKPYPRLPRAVCITLQEVLQAPGI